VYHVLLFIHIVCAVIWVGGAFAGQALAWMISRSDDPTEMPRFGRRLEALGSYVFMPVAIVLFVAGAWMTILSWSFERPWIAVSIGLWVLSAVAGALYLGPSAKRAAALFETEGVTSITARRIVRRMFVVSRLELASFAVIIILMVFKPGS
jgi:uncharacterized membrane protein